MLFLAAFIDSAAGGGGLVSIPSYLAAGFPVHFAYGTNKFTSGAAAVFSSIRYFKNGKVAVLPALFASAGALAGSWAGAKFALFLSADVLHKVLLVLLPLVALFVVFYRREASVSGENTAMTTKKTKKTMILSFLVGTVLGAYEGFFGPGTGTFLILAFNTVLGLELLTACGSARVVNMAGNVAALLTFIANGKVVWEAALPCALCAIAGGQVGTRLVVRKGAKFVRPAMLVVIGMLLAKLLYDFI
jgi:uncharacterized membrane protein YfcA